MEAKNFYEELIPDFDDLVFFCKEKVELLTKLKKYKFSELFYKNSRGEYNTKYTALDSIKGSDDFDKILSSKNKIQGVYILFDRETTIYVGVSKNILSRLKQHFCGKDHYQASLAYLIARDMEETKSEVFKEFKGTRKAFPFESYREEVQNTLIENCTVAIIPERDNYKMYLLEFYLACALKAKWNHFGTH